MCITIKENRNGVPSDDLDVYMMMMIVWYIIYERNREKKERTMNCLV